MASLTPAQTAQVASWVAAGATLSQVQTRLAAELGVTMTFMDVRFLVDDLNLTLIEKEEPKKPEEPVAADATAPAADPAAPAAGGAVTVEVDTIAQPHAMVSGNVTFSDGQKADWYIDHQGRPGLTARLPGYRPTQEDIVEFQTKLDVALRQAGF
ncbi:hypothetical protein EMGBS10_14490 [Opitutia bacterium]|nr:hypothetical protein EMGBS10_14490 [Opitutae bacterium]